MKMRRQWHRACRLQIPKGGDEMRRAFGGVDFTLERRLRRFREPNRVTVLRLFKSLFVPG
jgi:hypothetical protein